LFKAKILGCRSNVVLGHESNSIGRKLNMRAISYISQTDLTRLENLIELIRHEGGRLNASYANKLEQELEFAHIVLPEDIPPDVVTMRTRLRVMDLDTEEESVYSVVFPTEANFDEGKVSILAPLAAALLGRNVGDIVQFDAPGRERRLKIVEIVYQPEHAGAWRR